MPNIRSLYIPAYMEGVVLEHMNARSEMWYDTIYPKSDTKQREGKIVDSAVSNFLRQRDLQLGPTSVPNFVTWSISGKDYKVSDYGLAGWTAMSEIMTNDNPIDPFETTATVIGASMTLGREDRAIKLITTSSNYASSKTKTLTGGAQWDKTATSKPWANMLEMADMVFGGCNVIIMGRKVWTTLAAHPDMLASVYGYEAYKGPVMPADVARKLGVERLIVHGAWVDKSPEGSDSSNLDRLWDSRGVVFANIRKLRRKGMVSFTQCFEHQMLMSSHWMVHERGPGGSWCSFMWHALTEQIVSQSCGAFLADAIAA